MDPDPSAGTIETGGDSFTQNLNVFYDVRPPGQSYTAPLLISSRQATLHG